MIDSLAAEVVFLLAGDLCELVKSVEPSMRVDKRQKDISIIMWRYYSGFRSNEKTISRFYPIFMGVSCLSIPIQAKTAVSNVKPDNK